MNKWTRIKYHPNLPLGKDGRKVTASPEHIRLSLDAAREGMVLLKNDGSLPLAPGAKVALFGKGTCDYVKGGGGSGDVATPYVRTLADGLAQYPERVSLYEPLIRYYQAHVAARYAEGKVPGMVEEPPLPEELLQGAAAFADTAVISISRFSGEGWDRKCAFDKIEKHEEVWEELVNMSEALFPKGDFVLTDAEEAMVRAVTGCFSRVIVVLNVGGVCDVARFERDPAVSAVLMGWQAGLEGGLAEAQLLLGLDNPSGRLADTFAVTLEDYPSSPGFYESDWHVDYEEDIYVGYRYFETIPGAAEKVCYPFGYGLSYTRFETEPAQVRQEGDDIVVRTSVTNVGDVPGRHVVQVYYSAPQGKLGKPARALAGWKKTRKLAPGEAQRVEIRFPARQMASYDDLGKVKASAWVLEAGDYRIFVGDNVRDAVPAALECHLDEDVVVEQLRSFMSPEQLKRRMLADGSYEELPQREPNDYDSDVLEHFPIGGEGADIPPVRARAPRPRFLPSTQKQLIDVAEGRIPLQEFIDQLSDEDLFWLIGGQPNEGVANTFGYGGLPEYGVPSAMTADGPAGLRIEPEVGVKTTAFPCACLLACTWDSEITEAVGRAAGAEVKENGIGVWLAPAINIHRNPLCGRNFEYYSEDPLLTGHLAGALSRGVQSNGVAATVKHLALNNKETNRRQCDSRCSERAIREIYLKAFEIVVKQYGVWSVMTSYNIINGHRASENADMLNGILRGEWGFDGLVTTDWWTAGEHYKECVAGNDMKMGRGFPDRLRAAFDKGALTREHLELAARHILGTILKLD